MTNTPEPTSTNPTTSGSTETATACCGGPATSGANACCVEDALAKAAGEAGCGCGAKPAAAKRSCC